jgi:hypothetical protein
MNSTPTQLKPWYVAQIISPEHPNTGAHVYVSQDERSRDANGKPMVRVITVRGGYPSLPYLVSPATAKANLRTSHKLDECFSDGLNEHWLVASTR